MMTAKGTSQPGLFDAPVLPAELPALQRTKALELLGALLVEAAAGIDETMVQCAEVGDDADHR